jgi:PAS domain S-box-containing protein
MANELKSEQEQQLRLALDVAALGFYERDLVRNVVTVDQNWREIMGLPEGQPLPDFAPKSLVPEDRERVLALVSRAFDPRVQEIVGADFRIVRPDGLVRWVSGRGRVIFDNSCNPPKPLKFMGVLQDITARKETEVALMRARDELEQRVTERTASLRQANQELEAFCYSLSHDMRSPLRTIGCFTEIVLQDAGSKLESETRYCLEQVIAAAGRLDRLINDVLAFSRVSNVQLKIHRVNIDKLLREIISESLHLDSSGANIKIESPLPAVKGDEASLTQCFVNLLGNALKFVPDGVTPRVSISSQARDGTGTVRIWVEDNGIGIEADAQKRVFELFQRGHRAKGYEGTGAGLAIVARAVERMGGKVGVESEPGKGSRFWIELSAADDEKTANPPIAA